ncbi:hypothetical protein [Sulfurimonas sp. HSL3-7]|uniref:hypothetical protein n=1 Tax=Sulfonitrofixus jiaomeiensis TaxID=3131938 RepID=UPI0031F83F7E
MYKYRSFISTVLLLVLIFISGCSQSNGYSTSEQRSTADIEPFEKHDNNTTTDVSLIINGHVLPSEPDPTINNSTLLGIDANTNGVRDDVEIWIFETYEHPIVQALAMQNARAFQIILANPSKAKRL